MPVVAVWHVSAIASVLFAGLFAFTLKVGAERTHASAVFNAVVSASSLLMALTGLWWTGGTFTPYLVLLAAINGVLFIFGSLARSDALACIDATLFFPIYKIVGPTLVLCASMLFFGERLSALQAVGFVLALSVSVLLMDKTEHGRQKRLARGVLLAIASALLISAAQVLAKAAMAAGGSALAFATIPYAMMVGSVALPLAYTHRGDASRVSGWRDMLGLGFVAGVLQMLGFITLLQAFQSGPAGTVYAINSIYILIPIILSIWYYGEHWNVRKVVAVALSVIAVVLLR